MTKMTSKLSFRRVRDVEVLTFWEWIRREHTPGVVLLGPEGCTSSKLPARPDLGGLGGVLGGSWGLKRDFNNFLVDF